MNDPCETDEAICSQVYEWTENQQAANSADLLVGTPLVLAGLFGLLLVVRWVLHRLIDRVVRRAEGGVLPERRGATEVPATGYDARGRDEPRSRPGGDHPPGAALQDDRRPVQEHRHRRPRRDHRHDDAQRDRRQHRSDHRQRRDHRHRPRLRRPVAGQGLPQRHLHDRRGPVRRRRRDRRRRGHRHGRGGDAAGDPAAGPQRHRLVRAQRRDPAGRQHEPELVPRGRRRVRRPTARTSTG